MKKHATKSSRRSQTKETNLVDRNKIRFKMVKPESLLIGIFIFALLIRLLYINQIISTPIFYGLTLDAEQYDSLAIQILKGNLTHEDFIYLNPLYPFFLALIYLIFGQSHLPVFVIQAVIDSISCALIYYVASTLLNKKIGIVAALTYACYGIAIFYTGIPLASVLVIFFTLLFIASLLAAGEKKQILIFFLSGILFGLVVLGRPNVILFVFLLPLWFFTVTKNKFGLNKSIKGFLLLLGGFFMIVSLISIKNYSSEKTLSPFSVQGGFNFYIGNNHRARGLIMSPHGIANSPIEQIKASIHYAEKASGKTLTPSQASRYWLFKGLTFIKNSPIEAFFLYVNKFALFWRKEEIPLNIDYSFSKSYAPIFRLPFISFGIVAPFAILGIILSIKKRENVLLIILFIFSYVISVIIFFVSARYRFPVVPFLIICSSYVLYRLVEMLRTKDFKHIAIGAALVIPLFVGINNNFKKFEFIHDHVWTHTNLGTVYEGKGMLDEAISEYKKALSINPNYARAHYNLGSTYAKKGMLDEAISEYKKALSINPDDAKAHYNLGLAYCEEGRFDEAITEYKRALVINPNDAKAHTNLGTIYGGKGMSDEAISEFMKALAKDPNDAKAYYNLGLAYHEEGRFDEAVTEYKKALSIDADYVEARYNLGNAYAKKGMFDEAISEFKKAKSLGLRVDPKILEALTEASLREKSISEPY